MDSYDGSQGDSSCPLRGKRNFGLSLVCTKNNSPEPLYIAQFIKAMF